MTKMQNYLFEYKYSGKEFTFFIVASSEQEAKKRATAMKDAVFVGKFKAHEFNVSQALKEL